MTTAAQLGAEVFRNGVIRVLQTGKAVVLEVDNGGRLLTSSQAERIGILLIRAAQEADREAGDR